MSKPPHLSKHIYTGMTIINGTRDCTKLYIGTTNEVLTSILIYQNIIQQLRIRRGKQHTSWNAFVWILHASLPNEFAVGVGAAAASLTTVSC